MKRFPNDLVLLYVWHMHSCKATDVTDLIKLLKQNKTFIADDRYVKLTHSRAVLGAARDGGKLQDTCFSVSFAM